MSLEILYLAHGIRQGHIIKPVYTDGPGNTVCRCKFCSPGLTESLGNHTVIFGSEQQMQGILIIPYHWRNQAHGSIRTILERTGIHCHTRAKSISQQTQTGIVNGRILNGKIPGRNHIPINKERTVIRKILGTVAAAGKIYGNAGNSLIRKTQGNILKDTIGTAIPEQIMFKNHQRYPIGIGTGRQCECARNLDPTAGNGYIINPHTFRVQLIGIILRLALGRTLLFRCGFALAGSHQHDGTAYCQYQTQQLFHPVLPRILSVSFCKRHGFSKGA